MAAILRDAHAEGRLTRDEFDERLDSTYNAKTYLDLNGLLTDLPAPNKGLAKAAGGPVAAARPAGPMRQKARRAARKTLNGLWWGYALVVTINVVVWGILSLTAPVSPHPWPLWVAGPLGVIMLFGELAYRRGEPPDHP